jgi:hypothetical protein
MSKTIHYKNTEINLGWNGNLGVGTDNFGYGDKWTLHIGLLFIQFFIKTKFKKSVGLMLGFREYQDHLYMYVNAKYYQLRMPWSWEIRYYKILDGYGKTVYEFDYLEDDGHVKYAHEMFENDIDFRNKVVSVHDFNWYNQYNVLGMNRPSQSCMATIFGEYREWRMLWYPWLSWIKFVRREINIDFSVGMGPKEHLGRGTIGISWRWLENESQYSALKNCMDNWEG